MLNPTAKNKAKTIHKVLKQLNIYGVLTVQIVAAGVLMASILWLLVRIPEPEVHVTRFEVDGINGPTTSTVLRFDFTLHNPNVYKSIHFDVAFLCMEYSKYSAYAPLRRVTVNYNADGKGFRLGPRATKPLPNQVVDYTGPSVHWMRRDIVNLTRGGDQYINLKFVIQVRVFAFNSFVIATRQRMRTAFLYFKVSGNAFIPSGRGLMLN